MSVTITIPAPLRQFAGGQSQIVVEAKTAGEALESLTSTHTALRRHLFNDQNVLRNFVNVYLNDEDIRHASGPSTPVKDGDTIMIVPSIAGGSVAEPEVGQELPELSNEEIMRYSRHLIMPEVGMQGQKKLKASSVLMGSGGENRWPWKWSQPCSTRKSRCAWVSTPSATTCRLRLCARVMMAREMAASFGSVSTSATKDLSILS